MRDIPVFVDWLSMYQVHYEGGLPVINAGAVVFIDEDGVIECSVDKKLVVEGSYSSKLQVRCDGYRVEVSGNIGRFNRPDNVFGFSYEECVRRWNELLNREFGLPPFSAGTVELFHSDGPRWSGAINTRIDLCKNYLAFSQDDLRVFMLWLGGQQHSRLKVGVRAEGETIEWGAGSRYVYQKFYNKFVELQKHAKKKPIDQDVLRFVRDYGLGREEISLKSRFLTQRRLRYLGETSMRKLYEIFRERSQLSIANRAQLKSEKPALDWFAEIPMPWKGTALAWRDGHDLSGMSRATFYRHRKFLRENFGIDIAQPCDVRRLPVKVREIEIATAVAPDWYVRRYG